MSMTLAWFRKLDGNNNNTLGLEVSSREASHGTIQSTGMISGLDVSLGMYSSGYLTKTFSRALP
jgi:hypothetical protein